MRVRRAGVGDGHSTAVVVDVYENFGIAVTGKLPGEIHHLDEVAQNPRHHVLEVIYATAQEKPTELKEYVRHYIVVTVPHSQAEIR